MAKFCVLVLVLSMGLLRNAMASATTGGSILPYESWLSAFEKSMTGPVATSIALIGIVTCGASLILMGGEINRFVRSLVFIILVMAMLLGANSLMTNFFNGASIGPVTSQENIPHNAAYGVEKSFDGGIDDRVFRLSSKISDTSAEPRQMFDGIKYEPDTALSVDAGITHSIKKAHDLLSGKITLIAAQQDKHQSIAKSTDECAENDGPLELETDQSKVRPAPQGAFDNQGPNQDRAHPNRDFEAYDNFLRRTSELVRLKNLFSARSSSNNHDNAHTPYRSLNPYDETSTWVAAISVMGKDDGLNRYSYTDLQHSLSYVADNSELTLQMLTALGQFNRQDLNPETMSLEARANLYQGLELSLKTKAFSIDSDRRLQTDRGVREYLPEGAKELHLNEPDNLLQKLWPKLPNHSDGHMVRPEPNGTPNDFAEFGVA